MTPLSMTRGDERSTVGKKVSDWEVPQQVDLLERIARLHPFVVASFQVLVCVGALVAFSDDEDWKSLTARQADANPEQ